MQDVVTQLHDLFRGISGCVRCKGVNQSRNTRTRQGKPCSGKGVVRVIGRICSGAGLYDFHRSLVRLIIHIVDVVIRINRECRKACCDLVSRRCCGLLNGIGSGRQLYRIRNTVCVDHNRCNVRSIRISDDEGRARDGKERRIGIRDIRPGGSLGKVEVSPAVRVKLLARRSGKLLVVPGL